MADEEVMGSASPAPSDHKRKLDDLDSEPLEQPPVSAESNGNSQTATDADGDAAPTGVSTEDPDAKRPRLDDERDDAGETTENGHEEEKTEEPKEEVNEPLTVIKNTESEEDQEKSSEPLEAVNKESVTDEHESLPNAIEPHSAEIPEESVKDEHQESEVEHQDPATDVASQEDISGSKDQFTSDDLPVSTDQPTSRRMEVPSNKVGVLIGKSGDTIRTLQYSSGARIQITRDSEADPNSATRPVELIGSLESINKAERLIKEVIAEVFMLQADAGGSPSLVARGFSIYSSGIGEQIQIQVPNEKVGVIIGKGGETIKNLQTRSGARIQLIPQHLPEGDQSKERTVRVTGDRKQIEIAKEMIKEVMDQPLRSSTPSGGNNQQNFRPRGSGGGGHWGGPRGGHASQSTGYNNYPQRGGAAYPSQNQPYSSQGYGNYQPPPKNNYGWGEQRPPTNMQQGPPEPTGYDYYGGPGAPSVQPPMHSHAPGPAMGPPPSQGNYNYGQPQGPDYGQQPPPYTQTAPQGYGLGYGEPRYDHQGPGQHPYVGQGSQPPTYPQGGPTAHPGYGQQDQYGKPPAYNMPPQGPYGQPYAQPPRQQPYPASSGPVQQGYSQYGTAPAPTPVVNDGYGHSAAATGGYGQQGGQPVSAYGQTGGQQAAPGYGQAGPTTGYGQYPSTQPGYAEQAAPNSSGYAYQGAPDPAYGGGPGMAYGAPPVQAGYSQPPPVQPGYDQSIPQSGGYAAPQPQAQPQVQQQPQAGYGQYDSSQMYAAHR